MLALLDAERDAGERGAVSAHDGHVREVEERRRHPRSAALAGGASRRRLPLSAAGPDRAEAARAPGARCAAATRGSRARPAARRRRRRRRASGGRCPRTSGRGTARRRRARRDGHACPCGWPGARPARARLRSAWRDASARRPSSTDAGAPPGSGGAGDAAHSAGTMSRPQAAPQRMGELASMTSALMATARSQRPWSSTRSDSDAGGREGGG